MKTLLADIVGTVCVLVGIPALVYIWGAVLILP